MKLIVASVLLVTLLSFQPTLINCSKGGDWSKKRHSSPVSGDVLVRNIRGAADDTSIGIGSDGNDAANSATFSSSAAATTANTTTTTTNTTTMGNSSINGSSSESSCRYAKSAWTECDTKTNSKSRTLTLKKGEPNCLPTRTIQKKCKKNCRYDKGSWTECNAGQMSREDKLKSTGDTSCDAVRTVNKKCNLGKGAKLNKERKNKEKVSRRAQA